VPAGGVEARVAAALAARAARGTAVHVLVGNRDFLLGPRFLRAAGAVALAEPTAIDAFGTRLVASHGDLLCTRDVAYQRFRRIVRNPAVQAAFHALPRTARAALGRAMRSRSHGSADLPAATLDPRYDADGAAALAWLERLDAPRLLHGHTHRPATHALGGGRERVVLSDWDFDHGAPRGDAIRWTADGLERRAVAAP
jgi:UDP-2,3-diacylglucosamine hydrolase